MEDDYAKYDIIRNGIMHFQITFLAEVKIFIFQTK
jgi:hypothetical protein